MTLTTIDDHSVLNGRAFHRAVSVGDSLYLWAGQQNGFPEEHDSKEKRKFLSSIQHFPLSTGQWISRATTGVPPLGAYSYCCTALDNQLYYFGGWGLARPVQRWDDIVRTRRSTTLANDRRGRV